MNTGQQKKQKRGQDSSEQTASRVKEFSSGHKAIFIALCCSLLLFTGVGMLAHMRISYATSTDITLIVTQSVTVTDTPSPTVTDTPTATDTPTPTPTDTPTPSPTNTPAPTATPTHVPTATPTQPRPTPTHQPVPSATPTSSNQFPPPPPTSTPIATATATTGVSPTATSANGNGNGLPTSTPTANLTPGSGNDQNSTSQHNNTSSGQNTPFLVLGSLATGLLLLVAVAVFLLRKLLNPVPDQVNLPPSGARPWSRTPSPSMHGATNLYGWENAANNEQSWANDPFAETNPPPPTPAVQQQQDNGMWMPQNPMPEANNDWNTVPAAPPAQPIWNAANAGNNGYPAFASQNPFFTDPNTNGFPVTPGPLPTTGAQWGMPSGEVSMPFYAQNGPQIIPSNANLPTMLPTPDSERQYYAGDPSFNENQPPLNNNLTSFDNR